MSVLFVIFFCTSHAFFPFTGILLLCICFATFFYAFSFNLFSFLYAIPSLPARPSPSPFTPPSPTSPNPITFTYLLNYTTQVLTNTANWSWANSQLIIWTTINSILLIIIIRRSIYAYRTPNKNCVFLRSYNANVFYLWLPYR